MSVHRRSEFNAMDVELDGHEFHECRFIDCNMVFRGGTTTLDGCSFTNTKFEFRDAAAQTVGFMKALYHGAGEGGRSLVKRTVEQIMS